MLGTCFGMCGTKRQKPLLKMKPDRHMETVKYYCGCFLSDKNAS
jgi:hypothetical protein